MMWNWQQRDWPNFRYRADARTEKEALFLKQSGVVIGTVRHLPDEERDQLLIELLSTEAVKTSEIEGEILDRNSVQSSLRRQLGLQTDARRVSAAEKGISEILVDLYRNFDAPLTDAILQHWHQRLMEGESRIKEVGTYRTHSDPMQIVSGAIHAPHVHFEAPPSEAVPAEMARFCQWFNDTAPNGKRPLPALTRAGIAHLYFESVHPFEDGNGRIGRAIAEKALAQCAGQPSLTTLSLTIEKKRAGYYAALEQANKDLDIDAWLDWFADAVLAAQTHTLEWVEFLIQKTKLLDRLRGKLNARQEKALIRVLREGPDGFRGGLSAGNYMGITGASAATAGRDLAHLVELGAFVRTGERKGARYWPMIGNRAAGRDGRQLAAK